MDRISKEHRSWNMSRIQSGNTKPEKTVRSILHGLGYRFRLHQKNLPGKPDIVLARYNSVIFVHGCFWHRHKECKNASVPKTKKTFWEEKFKANIERDIKVKNELKSNGWRVLVVWECELTDIESVEKELGKFLKNS
jgi:DNA mismatch endonuclease (patch repair protein)